MRPSAPSTRSTSVTIRAPSIIGRSASSPNTATKPPITAIRTAISTTRPPITASSACKQCVSLSSTVAALQNEKKTLTERLDEAGRHARVLECLNDPEQVPGTPGQEDGDTERQLRELRDAYAKLQEDFKALRMENKLLRLQVTTPLPVIAPVVKKP